MSPRVSHAMWAAIFSIAFVGVAHAQHNFQLTKTVVKAGGGDFTTIQAAITALGTPLVGGTVLIYAGTYPENVTLDEFDENIHLIGIDPQAVIIAPTSGDGIVITSGTETSRNNSVRNLTINTTTGYGIKIVKGTATPKDIAIDGVTISAAGTDKDGVHAPDVDELEVLDSNITTADGHGIILYSTADSTAATHVTIAGTTIAAAGTGKHGIAGGDGSHNASNVVVMNCNVHSTQADAIKAGKNWSVPPGSLLHTGT